MLCPEQGLRSFQVGTITVKLIHGSHPAHTGERLALLPGPRPSAPAARRRPGWRGALSAAVAAAGLSAAAPLAAQDIVRPDPQATLSIRAAPIPEALEQLTGDSLPAFDSLLGLVTRPLPFTPPSGERLPVVSGVDLLTYTRAMNAQRRSRLWTTTVADRLSGRDREAEGLIPELENPLQIPQPLARVFGEGSQFDIQGKLHMGALGARSRQEPDLRSQLLQRTVGGFDLDLDQTLDLKVVGSVGTKLDVAVDFNSQRELESKQLLSATYTGTEDEILKKVEVGDINVILPPSRFLGGGIARGTFGAQAVAQLGPLDLRLIGSKKEGQSTERSLAIAPRGEGVLQEVSLDIKDTQFQEDRFFLLFHPDSLAGSRIEYPNPGTTLLNPASAPSAGTLNVWLDDGNQTNNRERASKSGIARVDPLDPTASVDQEFRGFFDLLVEGQDYVVTDGIVLQMQRQLNDSEVLGVSYVTQGGAAVGTPQEAENQELKLIKPINPDTTDFTWDYTLRNIYSLREPSIQVSSLELSIYRGNQDLKQTFESVGGESRKYIEIFGVSDANGKLSIPRLLRDPFGGPDYLVLPDIRPFFQPTTASGEPIALERPNRGLYFNSDPRRTPLDDQVYFIEVQYLSRGGLTGEIELGASNVIDGSEQISIGGRLLERGVDYQIFYDFGRIILNDAAGLAETNPNDALSISFEVAPLFNLAPTSLYGAGGTWQLGDNAVFNSTLVLQNQQSLANRPILGAEPTQTLIGTLDGSYARSLPFLTRWLDALPGMETDDPSLFSVRGELAWSRPDPNTEGAVYLNDFENIEIAKQISLFFRTWSFASIPQLADLDLTRAAPARWFTFAINRSDVTPGSRARGFDLGENQFSVLFEPLGDTPAERASSWRSIQTVLSTTGEDLTRQEFVEFFVNGQRGTILVDLGTVNEDAVRLDENGNLVGLGELDTEERNPDTRDNNLDVGEDTGVDGVAGSDLLDVPGDVGNDDFDQTLIPPFPVNPNGTENNNVLDTEDNNLNGILDGNEEVLRWEVDLADTRYEVPGSRTTFGYRRIRLPLSSPDATVGTPDLRNVRVLRLTFTGVEDTTEFRIVQLEIVGSTFLKRGIVADDGTALAGSKTDSLRITAINDLENPAYEPPPGVVAVQDRADEVAGVDDIIVEQSLDFGYRELPPGARGTIYRPLFDRESYIDYDQMRVWVQGRPLESGGPQPSFFVAFGLDTLNVYEYVAPLREQEWEEHVIDLAVFTELKRTLLDSLATAGGVVGTAASEDGRYRVRVATTDTPPPTLTEVSQLTIGVENSTASPATGSFWIDEWRLTEPIRSSGTAQYVDARTTLADFGSVHVSYESRGSRYRNLNAVRNNVTSGTLDVSATLRLEKLLPESWGLALPLTYDHDGRREDPLYRVGSDVLVAGAAERDSIRRRNEQDVVTLRAFRTRQSSNPLIAATLDRLEARLTYRDATFGSVDLFSDRGRWEGFLGYRHGFRARGLPIGLGWIGSLPLPDVIKTSPAIQRLASAELNLMPSSLALSTQTVVEDRIQEKVLANGTDFTADTTRNLVGNAQLDLRPFESMRASLRWDSTRDLVFPQTVIEPGALGVEALRNQSFSFSWAPPLARWLTPRYSFSSSYLRNHSREASRSLDSLDLRDFGLTTLENMTVEFALPGLVQALAGDAPPAGPAGRPAGTSYWQRFLEPLRYDRAQRENVSYLQEEDDPALGFTFGWGDTRGAGGEEPQNFAFNDEWGLSTGINPLQGMQLRAAYRETENLRTYLAGTNRSTVRVWPDLSLRWSNLQFPWFLGRVIRLGTVASEFERRLGDEIANDQPLNDTVRRLWDPILSLTLTWANGMTTDLRATNSLTETRAIRGDEVDNLRQETATDLSLNLNYNIAPGTRLYIPFPTLWGVRLRQPLLTSLSVGRHYRDDETFTPSAEEPAINLKTRTTEVRPSVAYEFGRVVSGFAVSYLSRHDQKRDIENTTYSAEAFLDFLF